MTYLSKEIILKCYEETDAETLGEILQELQQLKKDIIPYPDSTMVASLFPRECEVIDARRAAYFEYLMSLAEEDDRCLE